MRKNTTQFLALIFLAVLAVVFQSVFSGTAQAHLQSFVVEIKDNGFHPDFLSVTEGANVIWINRGTNLHWPASNFHPTHTLYPEDGGCIGSKLDACRGLKNGEDFRFTFNKIGRWPMHDHLYPGLTMVVEVVKDEDAEDLPPESFFQKILHYPRAVASELGSFFKSLFKRSNQQQSLPSPESFRQLDYGEQKKFIADLSKSDPQKAWAYLKVAFIVNGQVTGNPHELAHVIGNMIYDKLGLKGIKICDNLFAYGCYHGVTEELLKKEGVNKIHETQEACVKLFPPSENQNITGCIHGMGHGLLTRAGLDLGPALNDCDRLDPSYRPYCYDGVFMEYASDVPKTSFNENDPWRLCLDLDQKYQYNCARYRAQLFLEIPGWDSLRAARACEKGPNTLFKDTCLESLGYFLTHNAQGNLDKIRHSCAALPGQEDRIFCTIGSAKEVIFQEYTDWLATSEALCRGLTGKWQNQCFENNKNMIKTYQRKVN